MSHRIAHLSANSSHDGHSNTIADAVAHANVYLSDDDRPIAMAHTPADIPTNAATY